MRLLCSCCLERIATTECDSCGAHICCDCSYHIDCTDEVVCEECHEANVSDNMWNE